MKLCEKNPTKNCEINAYGNNLLAGIRRALKYLEDLQLLDGTKWNPELAEEDRQWIYRYMIANNRLKYIYIRRKVPKGATLVQKIRYCEVYWKEVKVHRGLYNNQMCRVLFLVVPAQKTK